MTNRKADPAAERVAYRASQQVRASPGLEGPVSYGAR